MEPVLGHKMNPAKAHKELMKLRAGLPPGEEILFYGVCNNMAPLINNIAVTNHRLIGARPPWVRASYWHTDRIELTPDAKKGTLTVASGDTAPYTFKMIGKDDLDTIAEMLGSARDAADPEEVAAGRTQYESDQATGRDIRAGIWSHSAVLGGPVKQKASLAILRMCTGEAPWLIIQSPVAGVLAAWHDRLAIIKTGGLTGIGAGALGGERSATFYFNDITGIEYNSGLLNGVLEVLTASYSGTANRDFWRGFGKSPNSDASNPFALSNTFPLGKAEYQQASGHINALRERIALAKLGLFPAPASADIGTANAGSSEEAMTPPQSGNDLSASLARLAELHDSGALSDDEFTTAKQRLLEP